MGGIKVIEFSPLTRAMHPPISKRPRTWKISYVPISKGNRKYSIVYPNSQPLILQKSLGTYGEITGIK